MREITRGKSVTGKLSRDEDEMTSDKSRQFPSLEGCFFPERRSAFESQKI
jgi:hypothetical protein